MKMTQLMKHSVVIALALGLTACGQAMNSSTGGSNTSSGAGVVPVIEYDKIEAQAVEAESALAEAQAALDDVVKDGRLNISSDSVSALSLTGLPEKLEGILNKIYDKLTLPVQKAKDAIAKARVQLVAALAKLDPANPLHTDLIARLTEMMARLDSLEARFGGIYDILADRVNVLIAAVDGLITRLGSNPLQFILRMELEEVRAVIVAFRDRLANT
ncbi:MAG: hypothetical protein AB7N80_07470 [Bdellovibrionales bacterium]